MRIIECNLPDVNFLINIPEEYYEQGINKINESIIPYKKNCENTINIEYIVDTEKFINIKEKIQLSDGKIYDSFKKQTHKELRIENKYYYLVNTEEYICVKEDDCNLQILVSENSNTSLNWIVRIIREAYLRIKEDNKYNFVHGTGLEYENKGILILGNSGSGKTTLAVKFLEMKGTKKFLSNDRVFINKEGIMDYFPQAITYAMGTVKNNKNLDKYFKDTRILEKNRHVKYEDAEYIQDCNTPLKDVTKIFDSTILTARAKIDTIIFPYFDKEIEKVEVTEMNFEEKRKLLEETDFTPDDTETYRKEWIRYRKYTKEQLIQIRYELLDEIIKNINIKKIKYGINTKAEDILNMI